MIQPEQLRLPKRMTENFGLECMILRLMKKHLMSKLEVRQQALLGSKRLSKITKEINMQWSLLTTESSN
jgi:hypothetical protein